MIGPTATLRVNIASTFAILVGVVTVIATGAQAQNIDAWHPEWPTVAVASIIEHADLDAVRDGIRDGLTTAGFIPGESLNFHYESAGADTAMAAAIVDRLAASSADMVVALTEPIARLAVEQISNRPVILTSISTVTAKEVLSTTRGRNRNVAGIVLDQPLREQLELSRALTADLTTVIIPFASNSPAAAAMIDTVDAVAKQMRIPIQPVAIAASGDAGAEIRPLLGDGAAILLPAGSGLGPATAAIAAIAEEFAIGFVAGDGDAVAEGATATVLHDPYTVGLQTAAAVSRILQGAKPRQIALQPARATYIIINQPALELITGIDQQRFLDTADLIHQ